MLTKYSPLSPARAEINGVAAVACTEQVAFAQFAAVLEHGGVFGSPIANGRWLFLNHEPPEDRVDIEPCFLSPEWDAIVAHDAENWHVIFFFGTRAVALELFEAMRSGADVDPILNRAGGGVASGPWREPAHPQQ
jgi:hypothetical protein